MTANVYECLFILDSNRYARDPNGVAGRIPEMVQQCGGEVLASRLWNEQKLAYPIKGHRKGVYWLTYFRMDSSRLNEFTRACQLEDAVLRNLVLRIDPRLVDTLVAHARGEKVGAAEDAKAAEAEGPAAEAANDAAEKEQPEGADAPKA